MICYGTRNESDIDRNSLRDWVIRPRLRMYGNGLLPHSLRENMRYFTNHECFVILCMNLIAAAFLVSGELGAAAILIAGLDIAILARIFGGYI